MRGCKHDWCTLHAPSDVFYICAHCAMVKFPDVDDEGYYIERIISKDEIIKESVESNEE